MFFKTIDRMAVPYRRSIGRRPLRTPWKNDHKEKAHIETQIYKGFIYKNIWMSSSTIIKIKDMIRF